MDDRKIGGKCQGVEKRQGRAISDPALICRGGTRLTTWNNFHYIAPFYGDTILCLSPQDAFGITALEARFPCVEETDQVTGFIGVDIHK